MAVATRVEFEAEELVRVNGVGGELRASFEARVWAFVGLRTRMWRRRLAWGFGWHPAAMLGIATERDAQLGGRRAACATPFQWLGGLLFLLRARFR